MSRLPLALAVLPGDPVLGSTAHPIHLTVTDAAYDPDGRVWGVSARVFVDDFEAAVEREHPGDPLRLGTAREAPDADARIAAHLARHLRIAADGTGSPRVLGREIEDDALWIYLEVPQPRRPTTVRAPCNPPPARPLRRPGQPRPRPRRGGGSGARRSARAAPEDVLHFD